MSGAVAPAPASCHPVAFDRVEGFGESHPWRLPDKRWPCSAAARLDLDEPVSSDSPFLDRAALGEVLSRTQSRVGFGLSDETRRAIEQDACFVIAGQQPGLLLGPAYVLYKAAAAIQLARRLSRQMNRRVLPAFWVASEDHRLEPLLHGSVFGRTLKLPAPDAPTPAMAFSLEPHRERIESWLGRLPGGAAQHRLGELFKGSYDRTLTEHFAVALGRLFVEQGLVLIDPLDLQELSRPVLLAATEKWSGLREDLQAGTEAVQNAGLRPPIEKLSVFSINGGHRESIDPARAQKAPGLSPGVALRPLVQDAVVPTVATVAGPTETVYLWQIDRLYERMNIRRSAVTPRLSVTVLDGRAARQAAEAGLEGEKVFSVRDAVAESQEQAAVEDPALNEALHRLVERIENHRDDSNRKVLDKALKSIRYQVQRVQDRLRRDASAEKSLEELTERVYPARKPQERLPGTAAELYGIGGRAWLEDLLKKTDVLKPVHWLMVLGRERKDGA
ncbi:MAG: bacillithiol biosynthesis BshC [Phycisphaeraceae bacterium]|nr:bacillithiol biosynthesis BshC [Phycisphaeraceae bacterium]